MNIKNQKGQLVVEYVLLLFVVITIGAMIVKGLVNRDEEDPGFFIKIWNRMIVVIGTDDAGEVGQ